jgi:hypothetical protein
VKRIRREIRLIQRLKVGHNTIVLQARLAGVGPGAVVVQREIPLDVAQPLHQRIVQHRAFGNVAKGSLVQRKRNLLPLVVDNLPPADDGKDFCTSVS